MPIQFNDQFWKTVLNPLFKYFAKLERMVILTGTAHWPILICFLLLLVEIMVLKEFCACVFSKVFDEVSHDILNSQLIKYRLTSTMIFFKGWFKNCTHRVLMNDSSSKCKEALCELPQKSTLGLADFRVFHTDLDEDIDRMFIKYAVTQNRVEYPRRNK